MIDLVPLVVALALGAVVVLLGLRRNLSETTRDGLPRFEGESEGATLGLYEGEERPRRQLTPRQQRWLASIYFLWALLEASSAVFSSDDRLIHAVAAALIALAGGVLLWRTRSRPLGEPVS